MFYLLMTDENEPNYFMSINKRRRRNLTTGQLEQVSNWSGEREEATLFSSRLEAEATKRTIISDEIIEVRTV